jgi:hypothetical protein
MDEDFQELDYRELELSVKQDDLEIIDQVLLADIARSWERLGNIAPPIRRTLEGWSHKPEALRHSPLGHSLLIVAAYARGKGFFAKDDVERAMKLIYRQLFGDSLSAAYVVPRAFETTELGQVFNSVYTRMYDVGELISAKQAYTFLGVSRQSLHDRASEGKLRRIYLKSGYLYLRSEIKEWKKQRELRRNRSKSCP